MTNLPPSPFLESVVPATTDGPVAAAAAPLSGAAAGSPIQSSPALSGASHNSGECDPLVMADCGAGEAFVLVERSLVENIFRFVQAAAHRERLDALPAFLRSPAPVFPDIRTRA